MGDGVREPHSTRLLHGVGKGRREISMHETRQNHLQSCGDPKLILPSSNRRTSLFVRLLPGQSVASSPLNRLPPNLADYETGSFSVPEPHQSYPEPRLGMQKAPLTSAGFWSRLAMKYISIASLRNRLKCLSPSTTPQANSVVNASRYCIVKSSWIKISHLSMAATIERPSALSAAA